MHTPDMSDEELDALFRRSAEHYPDEHNLSAWLAMERKLDAAAVQQQVRGKVLRIFALEAVIVAVALLVWLRFAPAAPASSGPARPALTRTADPVDRSAVVGVVTPAAATRAAVQPSHQQSGLVLPAASAQRLANQPESALGPKSGSVQDGVAQVQADRTRTPRLAAQPTGRYAHPQISVLAPSRLMRRAGEFSAAPGYATATRPLPASSAPAGWALAPSVIRQPAVGAAPGGIAETAATTAQPATPAKGQQEASKAGSAVSEPAPQLAGSLPTVDKAAASVIPAAAEPALQAAAAPDSVPASAPAVAQVGHTPAADSVAAPARQATVAPVARLSLALLYAPEYSTVRWARYTAPGSNLGVQLEYRLAPRWRLSLGALRSVKRYEARGSDYHPPAAYWTNKYNLDEVDALCHLTDIPLNLRYDVRQSAQGALFASAGLSSLLMRREQYSYYYLLKDEPATRDWTLLKGSNHFLSVLNLSAGYERRFGGRWAVQGEPFVKIPLGGVGFGKVRLSSAGAFFSLKYALLPTRTPLTPVRP